MQTGPEGTPTHTPEPKPTTEPKPDDKTLLNKDDKTPAGAPEKYEAYKVPDGYTLDETVAGEANAIFKEANLSQAQAQTLVDFYVKHTTEASQAPYKAYEEMRAAQQAAVKADPEIGPNLAKVRENVSRALDTLNDAKLVADFREAMDTTGAGDWLPFVKVLNRFAERLVEGRHVIGGQPSPFGQRAPGAPPKSAASALYPNLP